MVRRSEAEEKWRKAIELDGSLEPQVEEMREQLLEEESSFRADSSSGPLAAGGDP